MKSITFRVLLAIAAICFYSCSPESLNDNAESLDEAQIVVLESKSIEVEILDLINTYREDQGLNRLESLSIVKSAAFTHTDYMTDTKDVSHANFFERSNFLKAQAGAKQVSENVAFGFTSAQSVVNAWMSSESHRKTLVGDFTGFEVSAEQDEDGKWYYTNMFIKR